MEVDFYFLKELEPYKLYNKGEIMSKNIRYHINPVIGAPTICREINNCPYGGESGNENHFNTYSEAQEYSKEVFKKTHRQFPSNIEEDTNKIWRKIEAKRRV